MTRFHGPPVRPHRPRLPPAPPRPPANTIFPVTTTKTNNDRRDQSVRRPRHPPPRRRYGGRLPPARARPAGSRRGSTDFPSPSACCWRTRSATPGADSSSDAHVRGLAALEPDRRRPRRGAVHAGARGAAGFHRRALRGRPGRDARRDGAGCGAIPNGSTRSCPATWSSTTRCRSTPSARSARSSSTSSSSSSATASATSCSSWRQRAFNNFRVVPPGTGIVPPGQPRVSRAGGAAPAAVRRAHGLSRHAGRHRFAHHHDQRPGRAGLGRGRDRGRGGDAGPAVLHADARGDRHQAGRRAARRRDGDRPGAHGHPDAPEEGRGRQVRRVLRARA